MAITDSHVFTTFVQNALLKDPGGTAWLTATNLEADALKVALYGDGSTPDRNDTVVHNQYNGSGGAWVVANEKSDTNWAAGGRALAGNAITAGTSYCQFTGTNLAGGGNVTIASATGCFIYDTTTTTTTNQGVCFNYFGGAQSVTGGTFTINWNANGIFRITT